MIVLALFAAATATATPEQIDAATKSYTGCLIRGAADLDDGVSDAGTIAQAIAPSCRLQRDAVANVQTRGHRHEATERSFMIEEMRKGELGDATTAVLLWRKKHPR